MQKVRFILDVKNSNVDVICATSGNDCPLNRDPTDEYNAYVDMTVMLLSWTSRLHPPGKSGTSVTNNWHRLGHCSW